MLQEVPKEGLVNLMCIFNAILRLEYWPKSLKVAQITVIPKLGENPMDVSSYRPISLLPTISKVLEKLILKKKKKGSSKTINLDSVRLIPQCNDATALPTPLIKLWKTNSIVQPHL
jgi:hypothetical protein